VSKIPLLFAFVLVSMCATLTNLLSGGGVSSISPLQDTVDKMAALREGLEFPEHFQVENPGRTGEEFDPNEYFSVLKHLSMEPGYALDYVYQMDFMGGYPILYTRPVDQPRYLTMEDFTEAPAGAIDDYMAHIQADGTPESYFELVLMEINAPQFYLWWHAGYNDMQVVADSRGLDAILSNPDEFGLDLPADVKRAARKLDLTPVIEIGEDTVTVKVITFTRWGGFYQETYTIQKEFPHTIIEVKSEQLIPYDCGIMF
jgi:hypothetical protein